MEQLTHKIERLLKAKAINIDTKQPGKIRHRGCQLLPLSSVQPMIGDFCRSIVVGKDETRRQVIVHVTFLLAGEGQRSVYVGQLGLRGYIRDYDLKQEFSIFTYLGNFKQLALGSEIIAQVRNIVNRQDKKHFELTLKVNKQHREGNIRLGVSKTQADPAPRDWRLFEKFGHFPVNFLAQYQEDFANPGLVSKLCRQGRLRESQSLDASSLAGALGGLALDYQRLIFAPGETVGRQALHGGAQVPQSPASRSGPRTPHNSAQFRQAQCKDLHRKRMRPRQSNNNFNEGLREIKEALRLEPNNQEALRYLDEIRKEIREKDREREQDERGRKVRVNNSHESHRK